MKVLKVRDLTTKIVLQKKEYTVVDHLSFDLVKGKTLAIVGESGSGKSILALSLLRILPTPPFLQPKGEVLFHGANLLTLGESKMRKIRGGKMAMIFQDPQSALNPVFRIGDQLMESALIHLKVDREAAWKKAIAALNEVGIPNPKERMRAYPHELSGGMKQRVMIAIALMGEPEIVIADEPTTALDVTIQDQVLNLLLELQKKRGMALLLITHDMGVVAKMADECLVMYATQGIEKATVQNVFSHMRHPYTEGLFASRPTPETERGKLQPIKGSVPPLTDLPKGCHFNTRCPYVMPKCLHGEVPNFPIEEEHFAKCWLNEK